MTTALDFRCAGRPRLAGTVVPREGCQHAAYNFCQHLTSERIAAIQDELASGYSPECAKGYTRERQAMECTGRADSFGVLGCSPSTSPDILAVLDLSDRKRAERAFAQVQAELAHANRVATMGHLTASIAHEINQPIGAAITYAKAGLNWLGRESPNLEEARRAFGLIVEAGIRAAEVIDRTRALIKKAPPRKDRVDINEAVLEILELTRGEMAKNAISVEIQLADGLPVVQGDRVQLQQVVLNLLINAIDAMSAISEGGRELLISTGKTDSEEVVVAVRDSGPGLAPESLDQLFESFYTTKPGGLGVGLSICRSIIEVHRGRLRASANSPRGAIFQFTLPTCSFAE